MRNVDAQLVANVDHVERAQDVGPERLDLVVFTPVGVGRTVLAGGVYHPSRLVLGKVAGGDQRGLSSARQTLLISAYLPQNLFTALYPCLGHDDILALCQEYIFNLIGDKTITWVVR